MRPLLKEIKRNEMAKVAGFHKTELEVQNVTLSYDLRHHVTMGSSN